MLKLIAEDFIAPEHIDTVLPLYQELVQKTQQEAGCLNYELFHDLRKPGHFVFIEEWESNAALDEHVQSKHFQELVPQIDQYTYQEGKFTHMQAYGDLLKK